MVLVFGASTSKTKLLFEMIKVDSAIKASLPNSETGQNN